MAVVTESLGLALPATASPPQSTAANTLNPQKLADCKASAAALMALLRSGVRARDLLTRPAFATAIAAVSQAAQRRRDAEGEVAVAVLGVHAQHALAHKLDRRARLPVGRQRVRDAVRGAQND